MPAQIPTIVVPTVAVAGAPGHVEAHNAIDTALQVLANAFGGAASVADITTAVAALNLGSAAQHQATDFTTPAQVTAAIAAGGGSPLRVGVSVLDASQFVPAGQTFASAPAASIMAAITAAQNLAGIGKAATVQIPAGTWDLEATIGLPAGQTISSVGLIGQLGAPRSAHLRAKAGTDFPVLSGSWDSCTFQDFICDGNRPNAGATQGRAIDIDPNYCLFDNVFCQGWTKDGIRLGSGNYNSGLTYLTHVRRCNVDGSDPTGNAMFTDFHLTDAWIESSNFGGGFSNLNVNTGNLHVIGNHLDGGTTHNVFFRGGGDYRFVDNIFEGAGREAFYYDMPDYETTDHVFQLAIVGCTVRNGGSEIKNNWPAITLRGNSTVSGQLARVAGLVVSGTVFGWEDGNASWTHIADLIKVDAVAITGCSWPQRPTSVVAAPVRAVGCTRVEVVGNMGDNTVQTFGVAGTTLAQARSAILALPHVKVAVTPTEITGADGSKVSDIKDGTNTFDLVQTTSSKQPTVSATGNPIGGPALSFLDGNEYLTIADAPALDTNGGVSVVAVVKAADISANRRIMQKGNNDDQWTLIYDGTGMLRWEPHNSASIRKNVAVANTWQVLSGDFDGRVSSMAASGLIAGKSDVNFTATTYNTNSDPIAIGCKNLSGGGDGFEGLMAGLAILSGPAPLLERAAVASLFSAAFSLPGV